MSKFLRVIPHYKEIFAENDVALSIINRVAESYRAGGIYENKYYRGKIITTPLELKRLVRKIQKLEEFAFDTEFSSLRMQAVHEDFSFVACSFSWGKFHNYYIPVGHVVNDENIPLQMFIKEMKKIFERKNYRLIGHNLKAEIHALAQIGVEVHTDDFYDTMVAVWNIDENEEVGLKAITKRIYNYNQTEFKKLLQTIHPDIVKQYGINLVKDKTIAYVDMYISAFYALDDTYWTWRIYLDSMEILEEEGIENFFLKRQMPFMNVLTKMERRGIRANKERLIEMSRMAEKDLADLQYLIFEKAGIEFSITSGQQLAEILFGWRKEKPIYHEEEQFVYDKKTGEQQFYKAGAKKGQPKTQMVKDKDKIVGYEFSGNAELLEVAFNFPVQGTTATGMPKTGSDELDALSKLVYKRNKRKQEGVEMVKLILRYKRLEKLRSTYMMGLADQIYPDGKIHCSFNNVGTTSGRLSCNSPNLQQLPRPIEPVSDVAPKREDYPSDEMFEQAYERWEEEYAEYVFWKRYEIRDAFEADEGKKLIAADWSNLEMRILTHFSQDPLLLNMFATGVDAHGDTAKNMFKLECTVKEVKKLYPHLRQQAKTINFLLVYGGSAMALSQSLGVTKDEAQILYDLYFETYKGVKEYVRQQKKRAKANGYVQTVLSRKRHLERYIWSKNFGDVGYAERLAVNAPIQGSASDIAVCAQILIENDPQLKEWGYEQLLQVHDEIVGQCPEENVEKCMKRVQEIMADCLPRPLNGVELLAEVDYGDTYAQAK